jgi:cytosine/adenosine deaminase-related metal-dependent hydrolase
MDVLDDAIPAFNGGPVRWGQSWGQLIYNRGEPPERTIPVVLAHVNYCDNAELMAIAAARASVAYCPRTHAFFGHPPHRYREMLEAGINVCLGTDSRASSPDLSVLREARLLVERDGISPALGLEMVTRNGAVALGVDKEVGSLAEGKWAYVVVMEARGEDAAREVVMGAGVRAVYVGGSVV